MGCMANNKNEDRFAQTRRYMVKFHLQGRDITDENVLRVMGEIPREEFVPEQSKTEAYADGPLPIGLDQTISQPYIVALMTQLLELKPDCEVLEIGTGSGYQTAILARLAKKVYTIERFQQLSESAKTVLKRFGFKNIEFYVGDGSGGWSEKKIFDRIMITAAVPKVPLPLAEQLAEGGLIVAPVGFGGYQRLMVYRKKSGELKEKFVCDVRFVRLIGEFGFSE